jgi:hypothetical protein
MEAGAGGSMSRERLNPGIFFAAGDEAYATAASNTESRASVWDWKLAIQIKSSIGGGITGSWVHIKIDWRLIQTCG